MGIIKAIALGVLQGLTEFLPVSSSGHLVIAQQLFPAGVTHALAFDICLHFGTLLAVVAYFRRDLLRMAQATFGMDVPEEPYLGRWVWLLGLATIPVAIVGLAAARPLEETFGSIPRVGVALLATAAFLMLGSRHLDGKRGPESLTWRDALVVGLFQAVAVVPGVSRSASTISGGLLMEVEPATAARFAFLLSVPAILAAILGSLDSVGSLLADDPQAVAAGTAAAAVTGWLAIEVMMRAVKLGRLAPFAVYCLVLGFVALFMGAV